MLDDKYKVAIVGCGRVGMTAAYALHLQGMIHELVLQGRDRKPLCGEALDLEHSAFFSKRIKVTPSDDYANIAGSDVVVITAGAAQKPGETRLDLAQKNIAIVENIILEVVKYAPEAVILIVSNPVDVLTYKAYQVAKLPKGRIFGSGTVLDSSRFRFHLSEHLKINPQSIHAYILGEHGDSSFPVISSAQIGGQPLRHFPGFSEELAKKAYEKTREAAYKIIECKGATYYAIGTVISEIVAAILRDSKTVLPVSVPLHDYHGHYGVSLSVPSIVGRNGVEESLEVKLDWDEKQKLEKSVRTVKSYL